MVDVFPACDVHPTTRFHTNSYLIVERDEGDRRENVYLEFDRASKGERCGWVFWAMQRDALWEISRARGGYSLERAELMTFASNQRTKVRKSYIEPGVGVLIWQTSYDPRRKTACLNDCSQNTFIVIPRFSISDLDSFSRRKTYSLVSTLAKWRGKNNCVKDDRSKCFLKHLASESNPASSEIVNETNRTGVQVAARFNNVSLAIIESKGKVSFISNNN
ncbi:hypothetical protein WN51_05973 [Melipona quadrifasciata]|uniref:Uncharacterized protein n=1 Tax=Melipona quadrifasciata TaxID=166423 RepID=A0A0N0BIR1_9HYME|nr:hypothetical protein WN51_05973 [Melipona quadrifasciata]